MEQIMLGRSFALTGWRAAQRLSDAAQICHHSLDSITLALNLGLETFHLVAVEGIRDIL